MVRDGFDTPELMPAWVRSLAARCGQFEAVLLAERIRLAQTLTVADFRLIASPRLENILPELSARPKI
jgi:hypothetical protein